MVVDPDKDKMYTKRKTRLSNLPAERSPETPTYEKASNHCISDLDKV